MSFCNNPVCKYQTHPHTHKNHSIDSEPELIPPIEMILHCPMCNVRHVDKGKFAEKLHHTHACQNCGFVWRPACCYTVGVQFLHGFKDEPI